MDAAVGGPVTDEHGAIANLAATSARALDSADWSAFAACFLTDAVIEFTSYPPALRGRDAIVDFVRAGRARFDFTQHVVGSQIVELDGDRASSSYYVIAQHVVTYGGATRRCMVGGDYQDEAVRTPEGWRLASRRVHRLWTDGDSTLVARPGR